MVSSLALLGAAISYLIMLFGLVSVVFVLGLLAFWSIDRAPRWWRRRKSPHISNKPKPYLS